MAPKTITIDQEAYDGLPEPVQGLFSAGDEGQFVHTPTDNAHLKEALRKERDGRKADGTESKKKLDASVAGMRECRGPNSALPRAAYASSPVETDAALGGGEVAPTSAQHRRVTRAAFPVLR